MWFCWQNAGQGPIELQRIRNAFFPQSVMTMVTLSILHKTIYWFLWFKILTLFWDHTDLWNVTKTCKIKDLNIFSWIVVNIQTERWHRCGWRNTFGNCEGKSKRSNLNLKIILKNYCHGIGAIRVWKRNKIVWVYLIAHNRNMHCN
jgi:hypothetical protein